MSAPQTARTGARESSRAAATSRANGSEAHGTGTGRRGGETLEQAVVRNLEQYFADLDGAKPHALHEMVLQAVERPLLKFALERAGGNQSAAADLLGINRNTLRKKLHDYRII
jgi:Fis family transcriptional regulator, factor for inversion stimulation protein